jgi:hypothetical protein
VSPGFTARLGRLEIPARDPAAAVTFYQRVFGWQARASTAGGPGAPPYVTLTPAAAAGEEAAADTPAVGLTTAGVLGSDRPLAVFHVDGAPLDAVLTRVEAAGGSVDLPPTAVGDAGYFARFRDPEGQLFGLWQRGDCPSPPSP